MPWNYISELNTQFNLRTRQMRTISRLHTLPLLNSHDTGNEKRKVKCKEGSILQTYAHLCPIPHMSQVILGPRIERNARTTRCLTDEGEIAAPSPSLR